MNNKKNIPVKDSFAQYLSHWWDIYLQGCLFFIFIWPPSRERPWTSCCRAGAGDCGLPRMWMWLQSWRAGTSSSPRPWWGSPSLSGTLSLAHTRRAPSRFGPQVPTCPGRLPGTTRLQSHTGRRRSPGASSVWDCGAPHTSSSSSREMIGSYPPLTQTLPIWCHTWCLTDIYQIRGYQWAP